MPSLRNSTGSVRMPPPSVVLEEPHSCCEPQAHSSYGNTFLACHRRLRGGRRAIAAAQLGQHFLAQQVDALEPLVVAEAQVVDDVGEAGGVVLARLGDDRLRRAGDERALEVLGGLPLAGVRRLPLVPDG